MQIKPTPSRGGDPGRKDSTMTRQKKELIKKIDKAWEFIEADTQLGCGFAPADFYAPIEQQIYEWESELAKLQHYASREEMYYDMRGCENDFPFTA